MKHLILLGTLAVGIQVMACPQLAGTWECTNADGSHDTMTVQQDVIPNGARYQVTYESGKNQEYPADGVTHAFVDGDVKGTVLASCLNDAEFEGYVEVFNKLLELHATTDLYIKVLSPVRIMSLTQNQMQFADGDVQESHSDASCDLTSP